MRLALLGGLMCTPSCVVCGVRFVSECWLHAEPVPHASIGALNYLRTPCEPCRLCSP